MYSLDEIPLQLFWVKNIITSVEEIVNSKTAGKVRKIVTFKRPYESVSAGREKWPFNVIFF